MKLLVSSCARLFKTQSGEVYTPVAYGYDFYKRYLKAFDEIVVMGFCDYVTDEEAEGMLKVTGDRVSVAEITYPHGEYEYILKKCKIIKEVNNIVDKSDVMLLRVPETLCFLAMNRAIKKKVPFGIEVISDPINLYTRATCKSKYRLVYKVWYYLQLRRASYFANGTSYVTARELQKHYPPNLNKKDHFTTNYTDTDIVIDKMLKKRTYPNNKTIELLHVAASISGFPKGHKEAIECLCKLIKEGYNVKLVLVGSGELAKENQDYIKANKLESYIECTGMLKRDELFEEFNKADIFLFPSYNEGLPRVVIEAMSTALPVIASNIPAHRELLKTEYLSPVMNSDGLYKIAKRMIDNEDYYEKASQDSVDKVKEYDIKIIEKRRDDYYNKLLMISRKEKQSE